ncbi:MAG: NTP transferase domain-containing protein [Pleurocapsa sp. SU_196_0]|nr:NTP transferase domain-containing protein [Pleurocapsa sp. SU_196_0]
MNVTAVVLGGGQGDDPLAARFGVPVKALIPIAGEPMAAHVLRALRAGGAKHIVYVGPVTPDLESLADTVIPAKGEMLENLQVGLEGIGNAKRVLVATADIPLLTADAVRDVLSRDSGIGLVYPIVSMITSERMFPGGKRTAARVKEGRFTGGNLFLLEPRLVNDFLPRLRFILENRKNVLKLASMFGLGALVKLTLGVLSITELEGTVSRILGVPARALITEYAQIGFDVDKEKDLEVVLNRLAST